MKKILLLILLVSYGYAYAQEDSVKTDKVYTFIIKDSPAQLLTMRQLNESYLSAYRLFARGLNSTLKNNIYSNLIQYGIHAFFFMPLTHEEGHRAILTGCNIGSVSQPYFNEHGAAYVKGVSDQTLQNLRDNNLATYIRLHTGGLESDYMLTKRVEAMASFEQEEFKNYQWDYWIRKFALLQYYVPALFKFEIDLDEEKDELERDIVGHDVYGAARHLHRPTMEFYRYTRYSELNTDETKFVKRLAYRSFLNLLNPLIIGKGNFSINKNTKFNVGLGYTMSPFGDFIDENIWLKHKKINTAIYLRQFQNKSNWFNAAGISLNNFHVHEKLSVSVSGHIWQQPTDFSFDTPDSFTGGAVDADLSYWFKANDKSKVSAYAINLGSIYKTKGFLPEEVNMDEHFGIRLGISVKL